MTQARLYVDSTLLAGTEYTLSGDQANYAGKVLRCRVGSALTLFDGSGREFAATVLSVARRNLVVQLADAVTPKIESPLPVRLLQGVSKGDRMDTVVQKATELGVQRISPLLSEFSVVKLDAARAEKKRRHWEGVAQSACEQCGRTCLPVIDDLLHSNELFAEEPSPDRTRIVLLPDAGQPLSALTSIADGIELLIGPEGGFSDRERDMAQAAGFVGASMGPRVLRTETAAIAAMTLVQSLWGDMGAGRA